MSLLRRVVTFAIGLVLLQGNLAAVLLPCAPGHGTGGAAGATMRGVSADPAVLSHAGMGHGTATAAAATGADREHECDHRTHPENCASMASCIAIGTPAPTAESGARRPELALAIAARPDVPLSRTLLPDVPPPRV